MEETRNKEKSVLLALSGGVDSAVAALLLQERGFRVVGVFMKMWSDTKNIRGECSWKDERRDAYAVGAKLGIPVTTLDLEEEYRTEVLEEFFRAYEAGDTPNPDILCNSRVKFPFLRREAERLGCDFVATGHYARIRNNEALRQAQGIDDSKFLSEVEGPPLIHLLTAKDAEKDQTYFLSSLSQEDLAHTLFPIGDYTKPEVRAMAKEAGLDIWDKRSTRGICFVGKVDLPEFLRQQIPDKPGLVRTTDGRHVGEHQGLHRYTIGQRQGIGIAGEKPFYVKEKQKETNTLVLTDREEDLSGTEMTIAEPHWIAASPDPSLPLSAQVRYRAPLSSVSLKDNVVSFATPQRALTPGQQVVFYQGEECLGGARIVGLQ